MKDWGGPERFTVDAQTLFLLGNGPSLARIDLKVLTPHATLGMNAAYRYWRQIGWRPRFYACLDTVVGLSHKDAIAELIAETGAGAIERFLLRENLIAALGPAAETGRVVNFDALRLSEPILRPNPVTTGSHAALWAATAGFRKIVMLGIDGKYVERVEGARAAGGIELEIVEERENPNYFFAGYQQKGDRFHVPNPRPGLHVEAWEIAAALLQEKKVTIVNGNPDSAVRFFPFVDGKTLVERGEAEADASKTVEARLSVEPAGRAGVCARFAEMAVRQRVPLLAGLVGIASCGAVIALIGSADILAAYIVLALVAAVFVSLLFVRNAVSAHLAALEQRIALLEASVADQQRRAGAVSTGCRGQD